MSLVCVQCLPGSYSTLGGSGVCDPCPSGEYSAAGASSCTQVPADHWWNTTTLTLENCDTANGYHSAPGATGTTMAGSCTLVPAGNYWNPSSYTSNPCEFGYYNNAVGAVGTSSSAACSACPAGQVALPVSGSQGATACVAVPAGSSYRPTNGGSSCNPADPPTVCNQGSASGGYSVQLCQPGSFTAVAGTFGSCTLAPVGSEAPLNGSTGATPCEIGQYSDSLGASQCQNCPAGQTTASTGSTSAACAACSAGTYMAYQVHCQENAAGLNDRLILKSSDGHYCSNGVVYTTLTLVSGAASADGTNYELSDPVGTCSVDSLADPENVQVTYTASRDVSRGPVQGPVSSPAACSAGYTVCTDELSCTTACSAGNCCVLCPFGFGDPSCLSALASANTATTGGGTGGTGGETGGGTGGHGDGTGGGTGGPGGGGTGTGGGGTATNSVGNTVQGPVTMATSCTAGNTACTDASSCNLACYSGNCCVVCPLGAGDPACTAATAAAMNPSAPPPPAVTWSMEVCGVAKRTSAGVYSGHAVVGGFTTGGSAGSRSITFQTLYS